MMSDYRQELLEKQGVSPSLIQEIQRFRERYPVQEKVKSRLAKPEMPFFRTFTGGKYSAERIQGDRKKYFGRESGVSVWTSGL